MVSDEGCKIVDKDGNVYTSAVVTIYIDTLSLEITCPGRVTSSVSVPEMPRGSSLRVNKLSIYSGVILPTTNYVISVETTAGN